MAPPVAGYKAWYDASNAGSITSSGGSVSQWNDLSANGLHLLQATGANQPTTGVVTINGLNALGFGGSVSRLDCATSFALTSSTIFVVAYRNSNAGDRIAVDGISPGGRHVVMTAGSKWSVYQGTATIGSIAHDTNPHVFTGLLTGSSTSGVRVDGVAGSTGSAGTQTLNGFRVGGEASASAGNMWNGAIAEVIVYPTVLNTTDCQSVEAYLTTKWLTAGGGGTASPAVLATTSTFPSPTATGAGTASPSVLATTSSFPAATASGGAGGVANPAVLATSSSFPSATATGGAAGTASPATLVTVSSLPQPVATGDPVVGSAIPVLPSPLLLSLRQRNTFNRGLF